MEIIRVSVGMSFGEIWNERDEWGFVDWWMNDCAWGMRDVMVAGMVEDGQDVIRGWDAKLRVEGAE